jgi:hypothetical protein
MMNVRLWLTPPGYLIRLFLMAILFSMNDEHFADAADPLPPPNYDEAKVGDYTLPDLLTCVDGSKVKDVAAWTMYRRPELLELYRSQMFGRAPQKPVDLKFEIAGVDKAALGGLATRKEVLIRVAPDAPVIRLLLYVPNNRRGPAPVFLGMNFDGNHTVDADPGITLVDAWSWDPVAKKESLAKADPAKRGASASRWQLPLVLGRGYAVATFPRSDVEADYPDGWRHGLRGYYLKQAGAKEFAGDEWGAIGAWAWSLSRAMDYIETDQDLDAKRVAVHGHSRLGKTSLWTGATDERFAIVISNNSGEGGAAIARRKFGETTLVLNTRFPHWFCGNFRKYSNNEAEMPFDAHALVALSAPRPVYVASATLDTWADPRGEFLATKHANPVYALFGKANVGVEDWPPPESPVGDFLGYHLRTGKHDITEYDWRQYLAFADRHFKFQGVKPDVLPPTDAVKPVR